MVDNPDVSDGALGRAMLANRVERVDPSGYIEGASMDITADTDDETGAIVFGERWPEVQAKMAQRADYGDRVTVRVTKVEGPK